MSTSSQLDSAIPASRIASLSSGEFVGIVADNPDQKIGLKMFHAEIVNDHDAIKTEEAGFQSLPQVREVDQETIYANYLQIKQDIQEILIAELGGDSNIDKEAA
ncbi:hypothetical protein SAMN05216464_108133 [Mucilaginibacter pineti]|uniref:Uncharacterized protein n=1 Tax=Mucilaginibacter pineti TaxID=1391627 RepID=A0A1G7ERI0_9SPHI|nr:hypothetical protein [Mucilaginibacter pineti]SDE66262.1 hypothetical protein SAMN05216464_108133 [Mucilaginibacter pineti]